jgi:hypothetical protein
MMNRFKVAASGGRTLFVYGSDEAEARGRLPGGEEGAVLEPAGYVDDDGNACFPAEEVAAVSGSIVEGRVAPGA